MTFYLTVAKASGEFRHGHPFDLLIIDDDGTVAAKLAGDEINMGTARKLVEAMNAVAES